MQHRVVWLSLLGLACSQEPREMDWGSAREASGEDIVDVTPTEVPIAGGPWSEGAILSANGATAGAELAYAVAIDGDTAALGAYGDDTVASNAGAVYVFSRTGNAWQQEAQLVASDAASGDDMGYSVAVSGETVIAGAYQQDDNGPNSGAAYVFVRQMGVFVQEAKLTASDGEPHENFGIAVAIDGDTAAVGAHQDDDNGGASGSVYVFTRDANGTWSQQQKLLAYDGAILDLFGRALALEGDTLAVGAQRDDDMGDNSGSVYVFTRDANGTWALSQKLTAFDGSAEDNFGFTVSLSGDTLAVGAHQCDLAASDAGSAYVFTRDASGTFSLQQELVPSDGAAGDHFGRELALSGERLVVGAWEDDDLGGSSGSAYVFARNSVGQWLEEQKLVASDGAAGDFFGRAVALDGTVAVVGAHGKAVQTGAAYVYTTELLDGEPCVIAGECASGLCVDGLCCDSLCDGACDRCDVAGSEGLCTVLAAGEAGECAPYLCGGGAACPSSCQSDDDCVPSHRCDAGACLPRAPIGAACGDAGDCESGHCVDAICCASSCDGECLTCVSPGLEGECVPLPDGTACSEGSCGDGTCLGGGGGTSPGSGGGDGPGAPNPPGDDLPDEPGGSDTASCACRTHGTSSPPPWPLLTIFVLFGWRWRRGGGRILRSLR